MTGAKGGCILATLRFLTSFYSMHANVLSGTMFTFPLAKFYAFTVLAACRTRAKLCPLVVE